MYKHVRYIGNDRGLRIVFVFMELGLLHIIWLLWIWVNDCTVLGLISDIWNVGTSQSLIRCCHMPRAAVEAGGRGLSAACSANFDESIIVCSLASFFSGLASCLQFSADELDSWYSHLGLSACLWQAPVCTNCFFFLLTFVMLLTCFALFTAFCFVEEPVVTATWNGTGRGCNRPLLNIFAPCHPT